MPPPIVSGNDLLRERMDTWRSIFAAIGWIMSAIHDLTDGESLETPAERRRSIILNVLVVVGLLGVTLALVTLLISVFLIPYWAFLFVGLGFYALAGLGYFVHGAIEALESWPLLFSRHKKF